MPWPSGRGWQAVPLAGAQNSQSVQDQTWQVKGTQESRRDVEDWTLPEPGPALAEQPHCERRSE